MTNLNEHCVQIDDAIVVLRRHVQGMDVYNSMMKLGALADLIERHRQLFDNEIEGLRGDVKSAEAAYEREKVRADGLEQEKDRWTDRQLPGWRKRVTDTENALRLANLDRDDWRQKVTDLKQEADILRHQVQQGNKELDRLTAERDDWKQDAATSETKLEAAIEAHERTKSNLGSVVAELAAVRSQHDLLRDAYDNQKTLTRESCVRERDMVEELYRLRALVKETGEPVSQCGAEWHGPEFAEVGEDLKGYRNSNSRPEDVVGMSGADRTAPYLAVDNGEAGGDRTVVSWVCTCGKRKTLTAPKIPLWTYQDHCNCGAITSLNYED